MNTTESAIAIAQSQLAAAADFLAKPFTAPVAAWMPQTESDHRASVAQGAAKCIVEALSALDIDPEQLAAAYANSLANRKQG